MLKGIKGGDDGLEMKIFIYWKNHTLRHFTLKIRLREEIPKGEMLGLLANLMKSSNFL